MKHKFPKLNYYEVDRKESFQLECTDGSGSAENCSHNALFVNDYLKRGASVAFPLNLGNITMFHISFVPLMKTVPYGAGNFPGAKNGVQINIDRVGSYAMPFNIEIQEHTYITEKWGVNAEDAKLLRMFINTVLTGQDHFKAFGKDVMHKLVRGKSSKQEYWDEVYKDDTGLDTESEEA